MNHVAALHRRGAVAEQIARSLCRCAGQSPVKRVPTDDGRTTPMWSLYLAQAYGVLAEQERKAG